MTQLWTKYWDWYERNIEKSLLITVIILTMQLPHMVWAGDAYLQTGLVANIHPALDFFLYGIDLIEIPLIIKAMVDFLVMQRKKHKG